MPKGVYRRGDPANKVTRACEHCTKPFTTWAKEVAKGWGRFCSKKCQIDWQRSERIERVCITCRVQFRVIASRAEKAEGIYCGDACYHADRTKPLSDRLWSRVLKTDTCWLWQGPCYPNGYGMISRGGRNGKVTGTHRVAYELTHGTIPSGMFICHQCDNPPCVRPDHLFLGTVGDNNRDAVAKGRGRWSRRNSSGLPNASPLVGPEPSCCVVA